MPRPSGWNAWVAWLAHVIIEGEPPQLPPGTCTIVFRAFQEVVNNALKHSGADTITITLSERPPSASPSRTTATASIMNAPTATVAW